MATGQFPPRRASATGVYDSPDPNAQYDGRRPSVASITTASSQGSKHSISRGGFRKLQGFFGEDAPGRDGSDASLSSKAERTRSYSHSRPSHRDRNYSNATDNTREASPASSRPRTPVPAPPEVVPFLYQDNTVRNTQNPCCKSGACLLYLFQFATPYCATFSVSASSSHPPNLNILPPSVSFFPFFSSLSQFLPAATHGAKLTNLAGHR